MPSPVVTWTVFRYFQNHNNGLMRVAARVGLEVQAGGSPRLLFWGVEVPKAPSGASDLEQRLATISTELGEREDRRTEPDVILDFGPSGIVAIETKHRTRLNCDAVAMQVGDCLLVKGHLIEVFAL